MHGDGICWPELLVWLLGRRRRVRITGHSMEPVLRPGDHVLVRALSRDEPPPAPGELVWVRHPTRSELLMVKRVRAVLPDGRIELRGDQPDHSTDSRKFGPVGRDAVLGVVTWRFPR